MNTIRLWAAATFTTLFLSFGLNAFGLSPSGFFNAFQLDSQALTLGKIAAISRDPLSLDAIVTPTCRPIGASLKDAVASAHAEFPNANCEYVYTGNPAIHAIPLGWVSATAFGLGMDGTAVITGLRLLSAALTALVATWIVLSVSRMYGTPAAIGTCLAFGASSYLIAMAGNLYWFPATLLLPAAFAAHELAGGRSLISLRFILGITLLLILRFLSGFEFLTNVMLSVVVVWLAAPRTIQGGVKRIALEGLVGIATFCVSIALAIGLHIALITPVLGNPNLAWENFLERVLYRTVDVGQEMSEAMKLSLQVDRMKIVMTYLIEPKVFYGVSFFEFIMLAMAMICIGRIAGRQVTKATLLVVIAVLASLSWHILAKGHSEIHASINHVLASLPAVPILLAISAERLAHCLSRVCSISGVRKARSQKKSKD